MKYKLIHRKTGLETLCEKVTINGFDYYVSDEQAIEGFYGYINFNGGDIKKVGKYFADDWRKVIATTNPNIDIPKVVDIIQQLASDVANNNPSLITDREKISCFAGWIDGYLKSQETHPFSEEDMIEFANWAVRRDWKEVSSVFEKSTKELLQLWKEQKPKIVYYE